MSENQTDVQVNQDSTQETNPEKSLYTRKIEIPIYEPKNVMPKVSELFNTTKRDELIAEINKHDLPDEVRLFLISAAERHTQFNFSKIADFYAHANKEIKDLMENSALVIVDYDKAIENGFIAYQEEVDKDVETLNNKSW
ncbi:putative ParB protein [Vibrio phage phiKT1024]|nr:putative ParB protein [Vibrio phage phiKT1024]